jgi:hypothetical protein
MAAFATAAELASHLQVPSVDTSSANLALEDASQQIRDEVGWSISEEAGVVANLDGPGVPIIWLPTQRLTAVASVVEDGVTLTVLTNFDWTFSGQLIRVGPNWSCKPRSITVTYTHGWPAGSEKLRTARAACLIRAGRTYANPTSVRQQSIDDFSETFADPTFTGPLKGALEPSLTAYQLIAVA